MQHLAQNWLVVCTYRVSSSWRTRCVCTPTSFERSPGNSSVAGNQIEYLCWTADGWEDRPPYTGGVFLHLLSPFSKLEETISAWLVGKGRQGIRILIWYVIAVGSFIPNRSVSMHVWSGSNRSDFKLKKTKQTSNQALGSSHTHRPTCSRPVSVWIVSVR